MSDRIYDFKNLRPPANYPVYPPYHKGEYLEEYFYNFYIKNKQRFDETGFTYIPIFWTNVYITNTNRNLIQPYLDALPPGKYFTVSQHDDAVTETLPKNTLSFEAGGNKNGIPIPLICSSINKEDYSPATKDIFCSFVGSILGGSLRHKIYNIFSNDPDFYFSPQDWTTNVHQTRLEHFIKTTKRSKFTLCPRGYGAQSFRVYETLQLESIPVIVYDKKWLPFDNEIDWTTFSVLIHESELHLLKEKLLQISDTTIHEMIETGQKIYKNYFTLEKMCEQIFKSVQNFNKKPNWPAFKNSMEYSYEYLHKQEKNSEWNLLENNYEHIKNKTNKQQIIPKILHQIWLGKELPEIEKRRCLELQQKLPKDWEYMLWTDKDIDKIKKFHNKEFFIKTTNPGQKSDILRLEILNQYGGIYCDTDIVLFSNFNELLDLDFFCGLTYSAFPEIMNSVLGSAPNGEVIKKLLTFDKTPSCMDAMAVIDTTGPYHLTRNILPMLKHHSNIGILPNSFFYPFPNNENSRTLGNNFKQYIKPETICCHLWACSWMQ